MKHHLYRIIGEQALTFIELSTVLCRIEAVLNSRPLLPLTNNISDGNFLSPSHFLNQRPSYLIPEPNYCEELLSQMTQHYWDRWSREHLTSLQLRNKWTTAQRSLEIGDFVRIMHENTFPGRWPLGVVVATHPGADGW